MLETAGRCPLAFFFRHALRIRPLDELALDQDRWLDPLAFGSLLHEVFRRFMTQLRSQNKLPDFNRDIEVLVEMLRQEISKYRDLYPPANEASYRSQCRQLDRATRIFLKTEHEFCKSSSPQFMEAAIGIPAEPGGGTPLDEAEPVELAIGPGQSVRVRGRIDRIDRVGGDRSSTFSIWDYKTGSSTRFEGPDPFANGRIIQHVLYVAMAQELLRRKVDAKATVQSFGYFFPGLRGLGQRIAWAPQQLREGHAIIQRLGDTIARGAFLATDHKDDCSFCDYQAVCGDVVAITQRSRAKLDHIETVELKSFRELRRDG
jgi:ATP-dependent helicase/nuclease subunit B